MNRFAAGLLATTALTLAVPAWAQDSAPPPADETAELAEVVVTAQRRTERLLDVPVSVVVTTGRELEALNLNAATDLQYVTPGLNLGDANTPRGQGMRIRGVGTTVFSDGIEQSVGTVVDGVPLARAGQGLADLVDIERVEVLRGPQGLLFGRNTSAGLINVVTREPTRDFSGQANVSFGTDDEVNISAGLAGPIIADTLLFRISGYTNERDGYVQNSFTNQSLNDRDEHGFRGALAFTPNENLKILLRADWSKRDNRCCTWTVRQFATPQTDPRPGTLFLRDFTGPIEQGPEAAEIRSNGEYFNRVTSKGVSAEVNYDLGGYTLTSITAAREWSQADNNDADLSPSNVLSRNFGSNELSQTSQEFRITSPRGQPLEFVAGVFYFQSENEGEFQQVGRFALSLARAQNLGVNVPLAPGVVLPAGQFFGRDVSTTNSVTDYAAFAQGEYHLTDALSLIAGARVTRTEVSLDYARRGTPGASAFNFVLGAAFAPLAFRAETEDTDVSWRIGAQYELSADQNIYASIARGYKGPGYNSLLDTVVPAGASAQEFTLIQPEIPTAYEFGYKASLLDRRMTVSAAVFRTQFKDFQAQVVELPPGAVIGSFAIRNAGELVTQGFEVQVDARPIRDFSLGAALSYNDATFESFTGAACPRLASLVTTVGAPCGPLVAGGPNRNAFDASGLDATNAPRWSGNFEGRYERPLRPDLTGFIQANYYWRSETVFGLYPGNVPNPTVQEAYGLLNAAAGFEVGPNLTFSLFGKNLLDENYVTSIADLPLDAAGGLLQFTTRDAQRTLGVQLSARF